MDCDGVLTDGRLYFSERGEEIKVFNVRDGQGIASWHSAGRISAIISGRNSPIVARRATELGIAHVIQGRNDKLSALDELLASLSLTRAQAAYIGDDIPDVPAIAAAGIGVAVADAVPEVIAAADLITARNGGEGAVRELIDRILSA